MPSGSVSVDHTRRRPCAVAGLDVPDEAHRPRAVAGGAQLRLEALVVGSRRARERAPPRAAQRRTVMPRLLLGDLRSHALKLGLQALDALAPVADPVGGEPVGARLLAMFGCAVALPAAAGREEHRAAQPARGAPWGRGRSRRADARSSRTADGRCSGRSAGRRTRSCARAGHARARPRLATTGRAAVRSPGPRRPAPAAPRPARAPALVRARSSPRLVLDSCAQPRQLGLDRRGALSQRGELARRDEHAVVLGGVLGRAEALRAAVGRRTARRTAGTRGSPSTRRGRAASRRRSCARRRSARAIAVIDMPLARSSSARP